MKILKDLFNKYHNKVSTAIVIGYLLIPIVLIVINYQRFDVGYINRWYDQFFILAIISGVVGIINLIANIKKISFKSMVPFILITILLILCFIAAYTSSDRNFALKGEWYRHVAFYTYLLFLGFYLNAINIEKNDYKLIGTVLVIVSTVISVIALMNNDLTHRVFMWNKRPYNGIYMNSNHFGYYLSISVIVSIFLTLYEKSTIKKIIYYLMMSSLFVTIIANDTFGSYLGVLIGIVFISIYSIIKKKNSQLVFIVLLFAVLSLLIETSNGSIVKNNFGQLFFDVDVIRNSDQDNIVDKAGNDRMKLWKYTCNIVKENPWFGVGPNIVSNIYNKDGIKDGVPHNFVLEVASYNGIPALIVYLLLLAYIFFRNLFKSDNYNIVLVTCMISYLVSAFFGNMFFNTSPYFVLVMGMLSRDVIIESSENNKKKKLKMKKSK